MKFCIIGSGFILARHAEAIYSVGGEIVRVVGIEEGEEAWRRAIQETGADAIVIITPNHLHYEMCKWASRTGKLVLCEKPLGMNLREVRRLAARKRIFTVLQLRHHPNVERLRERAVSRSQREIYFEIAVYRSPEYFASWKGDEERSGGIILELGVHYFDLVSHIFGYPDREIYAEGDGRNFQGTLEGESYICHFEIRTDAEPKVQRRTLRLNGETFDFSQTNLGNGGNLHRAVYAEFVWGRGLPAEAAIPSMQIVKAVKTAALRPAL